MKILAAVIVFRPDASAWANIAVIKAQFPDLLVVDDSGGDGPSSSTGPANLVSNPANLGQAYSLNLALAAAAGRGYDYLAAFDQDTKLAPWYRRCLEEGIASTQGAIIGARYAKSDEEMPKKEPPAPSGAVAEAATVITSGAAYHVKTILDLGGFREDFFIDHIDDEICLRARARKLKVFSLRFPVMVHLIGRRPRARRGRLNALKNLFGTTEHAPMRWFYMTRNYFVLFKDYWRTEPYWTARTLALTLRLLAGVTLFEKEKGKKYAAAWRGLAAAAAGNMGRFE